ncbi:MAG: hypothetical protein ACRDLP_16565 [Solirubrobacteraceae bacterium]
MESSVTSPVAIDWSTIKVANAKMTVELAGSHQQWRDAFDDVRDNPAPAPGGWSRIVLQPGGDAILVTELREGAGAAIKAHLEELVAEANDAVERRRASEEAKRAQALREAAEREERDRRLEEELRGAAGLGP